MSVSEDPTSLRSYRLIAEIGRGGMADVFLAVARGPAGFNKLVVVKKTRRDLLAERDILAMFLDEARIAARMNHPNVVQTLEIGQEGEGYFIAMEYLDGQPYSRVLTRLQRQMPLALQLRVLVDALAGLHHAHELRDFDGTPLDVVHRDATPQNVFITYDGSIKVVDFGIAKALDSSAQTSTGVLKGKVTYMSPEQARGEPLDRRTDVFAVGVMLWEAIAGRRMWEGLPEPTVVHELMYDRLPSLRAAAPDAPAALVEICTRALSPRREERHPTALELHRDLEGWLRGAGEGATARDVGEHIAQAFEYERRRVREVIESQLHDVRWTGVHSKTTGVELPTIDLARVGEPGSGGGAAAPGALFPEKIAPTATGPGLHSVVPTNSGTAVPLGPAQGRSLAVPTLVALVAGVAVVLVGVKVLVPGGGAPPAPAASAAVTASVEAPRAPALPEAVSLTVRGKPAEARIYLDGVLLSTGTFEGKVLRSARPRVVRVEAEHYVAKEESVTLGSDLVVSFDLEKQEATPSATAQPATKGAPAVRQSAKSRHDIDADSPYKK